MIQDDRSQALSRSLQPIAGGCDCCLACASAGASQAVTVIRNNPAYYRPIFVSILQIILKYDREKPKNAPPSEPGERVEGGYVLRNISNPSKNMRGIPVGNVSESYLKGLWMGRGLLITIMRCTEALWACCGFATTCLGMRLFRVCPIHRPFHGKE